VQILYSYIEFSQCIIQTGFEICGGFTLTNNQCTGNLVFTGRVFLGVRTGNYYATGWYTAFVFYGLRTGNIDDLGTFGEYDIRA
jgi:hypothetical protein